jgi:hypothetical protein
MDDEMTTNKGSEEKTERERKGVTHACEFQLAEIHCGNRDLFE